MTVQTMHACCVAREGRAVLIRGASGSGKSALALQLMALGAELVADDRVRIWVEAATLMADCPPPIRGRIEARGIGILNAPYHGPAPVRLIVDMDGQEAQRLPPQRHSEILTIPLPVITNLQAAHFPAAVLCHLSYGRAA